MSLQNILLFNQKVNSEITTFIVQKKDSSDVEIITIFYNLSKSDFILVDIKNNRITSKELFDSYIFDFATDLSMNKSAEKNKEILNALVRFHRNNIINDLLG